MVDLHQLFKPLFKFVFVFEWLDIFFECVIQNHAWVRFIDANKLLAKVVHARGTMVYFSSVAMLKGSFSHLKESSLTA